jgi:L-2-hydroxyglutarate oxidase
MNQQQYDLVIIGGGIIGLSTGMTFAKRFPGLRLLIVEKEDRIAAHQTGHNSGVIHSGLYYKPGSLKAKTCVEGAGAMVAFCQEHNIPHEICGKLVVATCQDELPALEELYRRGVANGVPNLSVLGPEQLRDIEPHSAGIRALHVPGTGITDYVAVAEKYAAMVAASGGTIRTGAKVMGIARRSGEIAVQTTQGDFAARFLINCAGLYSDLIARMAGSDPGAIIVPFRGEYYEIAAQHRQLVRGLIYPVPDPKFPFLGVHFTRKIRGGVEAGPNAVLALRREGYRKTAFSLSESLATFAYPGFWRMASKYWLEGFKEYYRSLSKQAFVRALQRLLPEMQEGDLRPGGSGVRAQALDRNGKLLDDFLIVRGDGERGGMMIHVLNVPSPAATASLVIGRTIVEMLAVAVGL